MAISPRFWQLKCQFWFSLLELLSFLGVFLSICISQSRLNYTVGINKHTNHSGLIQCRFLSGSCSVQCRSICRRWSEETWTQARMLESNMSRWRCCLKGDKCCDRCLQSFWQGMGFHLVWCFSRLSSFVSCRCGMFLAQWWTLGFGISIIVESIKSRGDAQWFGKWHLI